eukprot:1715204-Prymnesium_polylepis.1
MPSPASRNSVSSRSGDAAALESSQAAILAIALATIAVSFARSSERAANAAIRSDTAGAFARKSSRIAVKLERREMSNSVLICESWRAADTKS